MAKNINDETSGDVTTTTVLPLKEEEEEKVDIKTGYSNVKKQQLLNNYLITKYTTRFLMSLKDNNEKDVQVGSSTSVDFRKKLKSLIVTSSFKSSTSSIPKSSDNLSIR